MKHFAYIAKLGVSFPPERLEAAMARVREAGRPCHVTLDAVLHVALDDALHLLIDGVRLEAGVLRADAPSPREALEGFRPPGQVRRVDKYLMIYYSRN